ncbi:hypothetical protein [Streptomyces hokutonensis]|uniref:hypothetical protein n=1 Tax=Streptomyces hokutonensis TaxID=1306990 RepID=UPI00039AAE13|nr:hypothetical protein [Streptomyces hokutonensis]
MKEADGGPVARMRVVNSGTAMLELIVEPYGSDHGHVTELHGGEIDCAHGRPATGEETTV